MLHSYCSKKADWHIQVKGITNTCQFQRNEKYEKLMDALEDLRNEVARFKELWKDTPIMSITTLEKLSSSDEV